MAYLIIIVAYSAAQIALGLWAARRLHGSSDFFVAGRAASGPGLLFATFLAANIGGGSTIGATGLGYRDGLAAWWWVGSAGIGSLVLALWVGPRIRRLAAEHDLRTVGDFLEWRYDRRVRATIAALLWVGTVCDPRRPAHRHRLDPHRGHRHCRRSPAALIGARAWSPLYFAAGGLHRPRR